MGGGLGYLAGAEVPEGDRLRTTQYELMGLRPRSEDSKRSWRRNEFKTER